MELDLAVLTDRLGHQFDRPELLVCALTHRSLVNEQSLSIEAQAVSTSGDNERLEYLGDAVLGLVVAEALFKLHPEWSEGELTRVRALLVSRQNLAEVAEAIDLGNHLLLSKGEDRGGLRRKSTVLSNTMEAVLGALFLDGGLDPVRAFVHRHVMGEAVEQLAEELRSGAALGNYKSALQEHLQSQHAGTPVYKVKAESGPDHRKRFLVEVRLKPAEGKPGAPLARGLGNSKKHAEQDAARRALLKLTSQAPEGDPAEAGVDEAEEGDLRGQ